MPISQNLRFTATVPNDPEFDHPPGAALMRRLSTELARAGWSAEEMDNWRDCGWSVACRRASSELEVALSWVQRGYWMLQISPRRVEQVKNPPPPGWKQPIVPVMPPFGRVGQPPVPDDMRSI